MKSINIKLKPSNVIAKLQFDDNPNASGYHGLGVSTQIVAPEV